MTINYVEKGAARHEAIRKAGHSLKEIDGVWVASDDKAVQAIIDGFDPLADQQVKKAAEAKEEASRRIVAIVPEWKQVNLAARAAELSKLRAERAWTAEEAAEWDAGQAIWDQVKALRRASDRIEADIAAAMDWQALARTKVANSPRWPE